MNNPLVTISIPTFNSEKHLSLCLKAIKKQSYKKIEVNLIDGYSKDNTVNVAKKLGVKNIHFYAGSLLGARSEGAKVAKGEYIIILDSDQILEKTAIERAVELAQTEKLSMLVFEETVYKADTVIEKLFDLDRKLFNTVCDLDPFTGVILPRFFDAKLLKHAYKNVDKRIMFKTGGPDHAIVYYEAWLLSKKIGVLPRAVCHIEPSTLKELWRKFFRWGYTSPQAHRVAKYHKLLSRKERFRSGIFTRGLLLESLGSIALLVLKGMAFKAGYMVAQVKKSYVE